jgi:cysteine desulfurase
MKRLYLDYAATTPVDPAVLRAMQPYFAKQYGNPGSLHSFGQEAIAAVDHSREIIAKAIGADFREIIFTGSATEANNLALRGAVKAFAHQRITNHFRINEFANSQKIRYSLMKSRIIVSTIEHESIMETARDLEREGVEVVYVPVNREGIVDLKKLKSALDERTILVSVMYANNEIGTIEPIQEISKIIREFSSTNNESFTNKRIYGEPRRIIRKFAANSIFADGYPLFHTDAAQAFRFLDCSVDKLGADLMTISSHKIYGPKGIGALFVRQKLEIRNKKMRNYIKEKDPISNFQFPISPVITGGGQEFGLRSGTENVPSIVGFAKAVEIASSIKHQESRRITEIRDYFWRGLKKIYPKAEVNGINPSTNNESETNKRIRPPAFELPKASRAGKFAADSLSADRLPNILNIYFPNHSAQDLLVKFDLAGIAVSAGSACKARAVLPSYTIEATGYSKERAENSIRFSFGRPTTKKEIDKALKIIRKLLK